MGSVAPKGLERRLSRRSVVPYFWQRRGRPT
jgi:hypothetical protein